MRLNISQAKTYRDNPVRWYYQYVLKRVPKAAASPALMVGTAVHTFFEKNSLEEAGLQISLEYQRLLKAGQADAALKLKEEWSLLEAILPHWTDRFDFTTLCVEEELEAPLPSGKHTLYGRPDRIASYGGRLWHIQNRSLAASKPIAAYLKAAVLDPHELGYAWLIGEWWSGQALIGTMSYGGTLFNIIRKLQLRSKPDKKGLSRVLHEPSECFVQEFIPISPGLVQQCIRGLEQIADEMDRIQGEGTRPLFCSDGCRLGTYGNSLCPYFAVCAQQADIHDDTLFQDAVDPYEAREVAHVEAE